MERTAYSAAVGERVYAVGDVHGCWDLLAELLVLIRRDGEARAPCRTRIVLLGDVIDRGAASEEVVARLRRYTRASDRFTVLMGNHEQLMWTALTGDLEALKGWLEVGGAETLASYGVSRSLLIAGQEKRLLREARRLIGPEIIVWLERRPMMIVSGDLVFVHAGVRPGVLLSAQTPRDLLWIRSPFLESDEVRPYLVVHGHSVVLDGPDITVNRIGLDTGAYLTGRLTAMGFEGDQRWALSTGRKG